MRTLSSHKFTRFQLGSFNTTYGEDGSFVHFFAYCLLITNCIQLFVWTLQILLTFTIFYFYIYFFHIRHFGEHKKRTTKFSDSRTKCNNKNNESTWCLIFYHFWKTRKNLEKSIENWKNKNKNENKKQKHMKGCS